MKPTPEAMDEESKVLDNPDMLEHPQEEDEAPDDESGEDPDDESEDDAIDDEKSPVTLGEPE